MRTSYKTEEQEIGTRKKRDTFDAPALGLIQVDSKHSELENLLGDSNTGGNGDVDRQDQVDKVLSGKFRWMNKSCTTDTAVETCYTEDSSVEDVSRKSKIDTCSDRNSNTGSELSQSANRTLLLET